MKATEQHFPVALFNVVRCSGGFRERGGGGGGLMFKQYWGPKRQKKMFFETAPRPLLEELDPALRCTS